MPDEDRSTPDVRRHELKTWPDYFTHLLDGTKTFEYRRNDRGFRVGDVLHLREWEPLAWESGQPTLGRYTGREMERRVTYLLGVSPEYVVMALADPRVDAQGAQLSTLTQEIALTHERLDELDEPRPLSELVPELVNPAYRKLNELERQVTSLTDNRDAWQLLAEGAQRALSARQEQVTSLTAELARMRTLAKEATNGWACYARTQLEHREIARLHNEIDRIPHAGPREP